MNTVERLKEICKERHIAISRLERECGFSNGYIGQLKKGTIPDDRLKRISEFLDLSVDYLMTGETKAVQPSGGKGVVVNVLGYVAAGIPIDAIENVVDTEELDPDVFKSGNYFGLKIKGDSMAPRILDGDTVIVRQQDDADTGDTVIALINGNEGCCKKLKKIPEGVILMSLNPAYPPMVFTKSEIDVIPVKIIGKVVELRGKGF